MPKKIKVPFLPYHLSITKTGYKTKIKNKDYEKIFVIGFNKTGTTSIKNLLSLLNFKCGSQKMGSLLVDDCLNNNYSCMNKYIQTADFFQDLPFSLPNIYKELDKLFPNSKFILTVRDSEEQWYNSLMKFQSKVLGINPEIISDLQANRNMYIWMKIMHDMKEDHEITDMYNKGLLTSKYAKHNQDVINYFMDRENQLLVLNVAKKEDFGKLLEFLNIESDMKSFPWRNKT